MFRWSRAYSFPIQSRTSSPAPSKEKLAPPPPKPVLPNIRPEDAVIAIMGVTGVGKSTFISHFSKTAVVGDDLKSCTSTISIHTACIEGQNVYLIDTPGFDDTTRTDTDILKEIAMWLKKSYDSKIQLTGIVYLHRIQDNRVGGSGTSTIQMFKELCGENGLSSVVLATTMWDAVPREKALEREGELKTKEEFWGGLIQHGCRVLRQDDGVVSAARIIRHIVSRGKPTTLQIQEEIASGMSLNETGAGKVIEARLEEQSRVHKEEMDAMTEQLKSVQEKLSTVQIAQANTEELARLDRLKAQEDRDKAEEDRKKAEDDRRQAREDRELAQRMKDELEAKVRSLEEELQATKRKQERTEAEKEELRNSRSWLGWCVVM